MTPVDITIPSAAPVAKAAKPATPASADAGKALLAKVVEGLGGAARVAAARDIRIKARTTVKTPQGDMALAITQTTVFPDKQQQQIEAPFGQVVTVFTPQAAFMSGAAGFQDLPASARDEQAKDIARSPLLVAQRAGDAKLKVSAAGKEKIGDTEASILDVTYDGVPTRWYVDPSTGRILRSSYSAEGPQGGTRVSDYSDYRNVDGLFFAFKQETTINGEKAQSLAVEEVKVNTNPDPKIFERPAQPPAPK